MKRLSDTRYSELFSHPYFVKGLLTHFVDEQFIADLDFSDMELCKNTFITEAYARRESDVIWRIRFRGREVYLNSSINSSKNALSLLRRLPEYRTWLPSCSSPRACLPTGSR